MERTNSKATPVLCTNNCGFFGSPATENLCSKCFRDHKSTAAKPQEGPAISSSSVAAPQEMKKARNRCGFCNKKVGLMGFECRCGQVLCAEHRYSDKHECGFDYKGAGQVAIARANPVVKADKIDKI